MLQLESADQEATSVLIAILGKAIWDCSEILTAIGTVENCQLLVWVVSPECYAVPLCDIVAVCISPACTARPNGGQTPAAVRSGIEPDLAVGIR